MNVEKFTVPMYVFKIDLQNTRLYYVKSANNHADSRIYQQQTPNYPMKYIFSGVALE